MFRQFVEEEIEEEEDDDDAPPPAQKMGCLNLLGLFLMILAIAYACGSYEEVHTQTGKITRCSITSFWACF